MQISSNLTSRGGAVKQLRNLSLPEVPERTIIARTHCLEVGCRSEENFTMRIHNLYEDATGESRFRDIELE